METEKRTLYKKRPVQRFKALGLDVFQCEYGHTWTEPINETIPAGNYIYDEEKYEVVINGLKDRSGLGEQKSEAVGPKAEETEEKSDNNEGNQDVPES